MNKNIQNLKTKAIKLLGRAVLKLDQLKEQVQTDEYKDLKEKLKDWGAPVEAAKPKTVLQTMEEGLKAAAIEAYKTQLIEDESVPLKYEAFLKLKSVFNTLEEKDGKYYLLGYRFFIKPGVHSLFPVVNSLGGISNLEELGQYIFENEP